jgi:CheY-like chemotaxis protein
MTRILVVDDDADLRGLLEDVLIDAGYEVMTASNGAEAMLAMQTDRPDAVLLDLVMPGMDGCAFLAACRTCPSLRGIPIGIMSAATNAQAAVGPNGPARLVSKPFDLDELLSAVADLATDHALTPGRAHSARLQRLPRHLGTGSIDVVEIVEDGLQQAAGRGGIR